MINMKRCTLFPLCWRKAEGTIETTWVTTRRYRVCEHHAKKSIKRYKDEKWKGGLVEEIEYVPD